LDEAGASAPSGLDAVLSFLGDFDSVFGVLALRDGEGAAVDDDLAIWVEAMIVERKTSRAARDFARADQIREELLERGIVLEDTAKGTRWKLLKTSPETSPPTPCPEGR
jgi:cysteinyl-tRNA synthetase